MAGFQSWTLGWARDQAHGAADGLPASGVLPGTGGQLGVAGRAHPRFKAALNILNLFGYTGVASLVCAAAGQGTHVDASKKSLWAGQGKMHGPPGLALRRRCAGSPRMRKLCRPRCARGEVRTASFSTLRNTGVGRAVRCGNCWEDLPRLPIAAAPPLPECPFLLLERLCGGISRLSTRLSMGTRSRGRGGRIDWGELALMEQGSERGIGRFSPDGGPMSPWAITSLTNLTVKAVRALHMRKEREATGQFLAEGLKIVTEAVELGHARRS